MRLAGNEFSPPGCIRHENIAGPSVELGHRLDGKHAQLYRRLQTDFASDRMSHPSSWPVAIDAGSLVAGDPVR
jgi:hypothetical protein